MATEEYTPQERQSAAPTPPHDQIRGAVPTLTPAQADESARQRAGARKTFPTADEDEIARSAEEGGPPVDVPPTHVRPPTG